MLEWKSKNALLKLPQAVSCVSSPGKPNAKSERGEKSPVTATSHGDGDREGKPPCKQADQEKQLNAGATKPGAANVQSTLGKTSPVTRPGFRKPSYNPITHTTGIEMYVFALIDLLFSLTKLYCYTLFF